MDIAAIKQIVPDVTARQIEQLTAYCDMITDWNQRINLVSRKDIEFFEENHLLPSIVALEMVDIPQNSSLADIGSGGGLPAIPIAILRQDIEVTMLESILKKSVFLQNVVEELELGNARVVRSRVEDLGGDYKKSFDMVTARAVASVGQLIKWGKPLLRSGGQWTLWKGESDREDLFNSVRKIGYPIEIFDVPEHLHSLSGKFEFMRIFQIDMI
ncbi:MAG: 16S rRNA (guanine(527)-N(7))-methyltransferase RsmG [Calditrichia bacterium]